MKITRRDALQSVVASIVAGAMAPARASIGAIGRSVAAVGGQTGFYPAGHWTNSAQPLTLVYPRSDSETNTYARHRWAYWDGTNDIEYSVCVGIEFGAYPYVFELIDGPSGMVISQPIYDGFQNSAYGRVTWRPQGNISSSITGQTVTVRVTDQAHNTLDVTWTISTSSSTNQFVFVDGTNGDDSNTGTIDAPLKTLGVINGATGAFGATFAASTYPGAICYVKSGTYTLPAYTDNDMGVAAQFEFDNAKKPSALIAFPGETITLTTTSGTFGLGINGSASDLFVQNVSADGYNSSASNFALFYIAASGNLRMTLDGVSWSNAGYGTTGNDNASMFTSQGVVSPNSYLFITDCGETGRQSGTPGNNCAGCDIYSYQYALVQRSSASNPSGSCDFSWWIKSDGAYCTVRECSANFQSLSRAFVVGAQNQYVVTENNESCYNLGIGVSKISAPDTLGFTYGPLSAYRNSLIAGSGDGLYCASPNYNLQGPLIVSATPTAGSGSLAAGTYYYAATAIGVSGESAAIYGGGAGTAGGYKVAGGSNEISATLSTAGEIALDLSAMPMASSIRVYRGSSAGAENEYVDIASATQWTDDGTATWTSAKSPASSSAISSARFAFDSNAIQTTYSSVIPTGATVSTDGNNLVDSSGDAMNSDGTLNPSYSGYNGLYGKVGYQIA